MRLHSTAQFLLIVLAAIALAPLILLGAVGLVLVDRERLEADASDSDEAASPSLPQAIVTA